MGLEGQALPHANSQGMAREVLDPGGQQKAGSYLSLPEERSSSDSNTSDPLVLGPWNNHRHQPFNHCLRERETHTHATNKKQQQAQRVH